MRPKTKRALPILFIAFAIRVIGAVVTTVTNLNPDSQHDAIGFGNTAALIARGLIEADPYRYVSGSVGLVQWLNPLARVDIYYVIGSFLAPFWLIPGPSSLYARVGNAFLGAYAIYNVYLIARHYHSHQAGVVAAVPMIFYPSMIAVHSTLLREAIILFAITTAARLLMVPSQHRNQLISYIMAAGLIHIALLLRDDNIFIYGLALGTGAAVYAYKAGHLSKRVGGISAILSSLVFVIFLPVIRDAISFLAYTRKLRATGRAAYLPETLPQTVIELVVFSWIGAAYFLYAPFPWMVETIPDLLVSVEGLITFSFTIISCWGIRSLNKKNSPAAMGLLAGLVIAVVLYGVGTANYGTGMRHRQMFTWVIFLFGGIGLSNFIQFNINDGGRF